MQKNHTVLPIPRTRIPAALALAMVLIATLMAAMFLATPARATDAALVSNVGQTTSSTGVEVSTLEQAQIFRTGPNALGYDLNSIDIGIMNAPNASDVHNVDVSIWSTHTATNVQNESDIVPNTRRFTLTNPSSMSDGVNTFSVSGNRTLEPNTSYAVHIRYTGSDNNFSIQRTYANNENTGSSPGWWIDDFRHERDRYSTKPWSRQAAEAVIQVNGSLIVPTDAPPRVTNVRLTSGLNDIRARWDPALTATGYRVQWKTGSQDYTSSRTREVTGTSARISPLQADTEYTVRIIAFNDIGNATAHEQQISTSLDTDKHVLTIEAVNRTVTEGQYARFIIRNEGTLSETTNLSIHARGEYGIHNGTGSKTEPTTGLESSEVSFLIDDDDWPVPSYDLTVWIAPHDRVNRRIAEATIRVLDNDSSARKAPQAPYRLDAISGNGRVHLEWQAPRSNGGDSVDEYEYRVQNQWTDRGTTDWVFNGTSTNRLITGLENDVQNWTYYSFEVRAVNVYGKGLIAKTYGRPSANPDLAGVPGRPRNLNATPDASGNINLSWSAPRSVSGNHPVSDSDPRARYEYIIQTRGSSGPETWSSWWRSTGGTSTSFKVPQSQLLSGRPYVFKVRAVNRNGPGGQTNDLWATPSGGRMSAEQGGNTDPLTASLDQKPESHDGSSEHSFRVLFSDDIHNAAADLPDAFTILNANLGAASKVDDRADPVGDTIHPHRRRRRLHTPPGEPGLRTGPRPLHRRRPSTDNRPGHPHLGPQQRAAASGPDRHPEHGGRQPPRRRLHVPVHHQLQRRTQETLQL